MVGVVYTKRIVVPTGGAASLAQVSVLMDVDGCGPTISEKATNLKEDRESSLRVFLLEQHVTVQFGQILWQRGAGSHVAGCVQAAIVLIGLRWSRNVTESWAAMLKTSQQQRCQRNHRPEIQLV